MARSPLLEDLKELAWAVFLLVLIALLLGVLSGRHLGRAGTAMGLGFAAFIVVVFASIASLNLLWIAALRLRARRRRSAPTSTPGPP